MSLNLFEGIGIEIEYMIVDCDTLSIQPVAETILIDSSGESVCELNKGTITCSNELVAHVIELKTTQPEKTLHGLDTLFHKEILDINTLLSRHNCVLLGTAMHPFMNTDKETVLWSHGDDSVYKAFSKIFGCKGHGFSNIQSVHINLPFNGDEQFAVLHTAIRLVLPLIPALSASSPIADNKITGFSDSRLEYYRNNQNKIPSITGDIIPECITSKDEYQTKIFNRIYADIAPYDSDAVLQHEWLNSRGAIARFDRDSIEIRLIDTQECSKADLAICSLVISVIKMFVFQKISSFEQQKKWSEKNLKEILLTTIQNGGCTIITDHEYLQLFGIQTTTCNATDLWKHIYTNILCEDKSLHYYNEEISLILEKGTLSERIIQSLNNNYSHENMTIVYKKLIKSLKENKQYV